MTSKASDIIRGWPRESREAAQLVLDRYGEPDEATDGALVWRRCGEWKRIVASKSFWQHDFPAPHQDCVQCVIDYRVPPEKFAELAAFDGSVIAERTAGELSARCHDVEANRLALNLAHDIIAGDKTARQARNCYAQEFLDYRRGKPTPYMDKLHFTPPVGPAADPDQRVLSDEDLERARSEGQRRETAYAEMA